MTLNSKHPFSRVFSLYLKPSSLKTIATNMRKTIPHPAAKPSRQAKSWRKLKPRQLLRNTREFVVREEGREFANGVIWCVTEVMDGGVRLKALGFDFEWEWVWDDWDDYFERTKKPPKNTPERELVDEILDEMK